MATPDITNLVTIVALIAVSCLISYLVAQHTLKQADHHAREQLELRLAGLTSAIADLELRIERLTDAPHPIGVARAGTTVANLAAEAKASGAVVGAQSKPAAEIPTETLILISAAVTSFLGKPVRIRSAKMLQSPYEIVNPWAQQGRVIVQASHNLQVRHL